jgi:hypothetical protein
MMCGWLLRASVASLACDIGQGRLRGQLHHLLVIGVQVPLGIVSVRGSRSFRSGVRGPSGCTNQAHCDCGGTLLGQGNVWLASQCF